jgi:toxin YoeB
MTIEFSLNAWEDLSFWIREDYSKVEKIKELINAITKTPFVGIGKPEPLKQNLKGYWSRRINDEHRLVYKISGDSRKTQVCYILSCRFHYQ